MIRHSQLVRDAIEILIIVIKLTRCATRCRAPTADGKAIFILKDNITYELFLSIEEGSQTYLIWRTLL